VNLRPVVRLDFSQWLREPPARIVWVGHGHLDIASPSVPAAPAPLAASSAADGTTSTDI